MSIKKLLPVPPTATDIPVTLEEARNHERIDLVDAANDVLIQNQLYAATRLAEEFMRRATGFQTWEYRTSKIAPIMEIPRPPLQRIIPNSEDATSMVFTDWNDNDTAIDDDTWFEDTVDEPGRLIFKSNASLPYGFPYGWAGWSGDFYGAGGYITIKFECGYGADAPTAVTDTPWEIKEGILQIFGFLYQNREGQAIPCGSVAHTFLQPFQVEYL